MNKILITITLVAAFTFIIVGVNTVQAQTILDIPDMDRHMTIAISESKTDMGKIMGFELQ